MSKYNKILSTLVLLSLVAFTLLAFPSPAFADAKLTVVVRDCETKAPIADAVVTITTADGTPSRKTNANGQVVFQGVSPDDENHTVTVDATGYPRATAVKYLGESEAAGLSFCLRKAPAATPTRPPTATPLPLPTQPPQPTQPPEALPTAGVEPTGAVPGGVSVATCPSNLNRILSMQFGAAEGAALVPGSVSDGVCQGDANPLCARDQIFKPVFAATGAHMVQKAVAKELAAQTGWAILSDPQGIETCGSAPAYGLSLAQQFSIAGLRLDYIGVQTTGRAVVINSEGQRAGVLEDGSAVEEIPGSKAGTLGGHSHILVPSGSLNQVTMQALSDGTLTVDVVRTVGDGPGAYVDAASFENLPVSPAWNATLEVSSGEPELSIDAGDGQPQVIASTWIERNPVDAAGLAFWEGAGAQPTAAPGASLTPGAPAVPETGFNLRANLVPVLLIGGGIGLVMVVIALAIVYFFFIRKRDEDEDEE